MPFLFIYHSRAANRQNCTNSSINKPYHHFRCRHPTKRLIALRCRPYYWRMPLKCYTITCGSSIAVPHGIASDGAAYIQYINKDARQSWHQRQYVPSRRQYITSHGGADPSQRHRMQYMHKQAHQTRSQICACVAPSDTASQRQQMYVDAP